jgi:5,5'-dehydrodivanillate O-demethylase
VPPQGAIVDPRLTDKVHLYEVPLRDSEGEFILDNIDGQDIMAWITQGPIADRTQEHLGASDQGIAMYRRILDREIRRVEAGLDPMATIRDPARNLRIDLPNERKKHHNSDGLRSWMMRTHAAWSPILDDLIDLFEPGKPGPVRLAG